MATHEWEYEIGEGFEPGLGVVTTDTAPPGKVDYSLTMHSHEDAEAEEILCREILRLAEENNALKATLEESNEIEAETLAALAVLCGDGTVKGCVNGCPGHLKPEAMKRFKESLGRWLAMQEENRNLGIAVERLEAENVKLTEGGRVLLKALRILAHEMWVCFKEDMDLDSVANREALEAAGLIEMLADQTWSLTELGGRVCRREP